MTSAVPLIAARNRTLRDFRVGPTAEVARLLDGSWAGGSGVSTSGRSQSQAGNSQIGHDELSGYSHPDSLAFDCPSPKEGERLAGRKALRSILTLLPGLLSIGLAQPTSAVEAPSFDWSGLYVGGHVAYGRGNIGGTLFEPDPTQSSRGFGSPSGSAPFSELRSNGGGAENTASDLHWPVFHLIRKTQRLTKC